MKNEIMKRKKKGFTLVEIIVVLVILAVLAAVTIPSMLGFIDEAKGKTEIANARAAYLAAQMVATEKSAMGVPDETPSGGTATSIESLINQTISAAGTDAMSQRLGKDMAGAVISKADVVGGKVAALTFTHNEYVVTMTGLNTTNGIVEVAPVKTTP